SQFCLLCFRELVCSVQIQNLIRQPGLDPPARQGSIVPEDPAFDELIGPRLALRHEHVVDNEHRLGWLGARGSYATDQDQRRCNRSRHTTPFGHGCMKWSLRHAGRKIKPGAVGRDMPRQIAKGNVDRKFRSWSEWPVIGQAPGTRSRAGVPDAGAYFLTRS